jgi:hypothetical protein
MNDHKPLLWAQGENANVKEPIEALREHGWRYGDVPAASNFNWLFKTLTEEIATLRKDLLMQKEHLLQQLTQQAHDQEEKLHAKAKELYDRTTRHSKRHLMDSAFNRDVSRQMCDLLREMEKLLQHYHRDFPTLPWPLKTENITEMTVDEESLD